MLLIFGKNAPVLLVLYGDISGKGLDARALATINALAVLCNAALAAMSVLSLTIIWCALVRRAVWALWSLAASVLFLQAASFASDSLLHQPDVLGNAAALSIPVVGIVFAALGILRRSHKSAADGAT
jgi:hypothetical protein